MELFQRSCGTLLHITSLPSKNGIGDFGKAAYNFVDILKKAKISLWQILPICPVGPGNSPYSSISSFAGNALLINLEDLIDNGLLEKSDLNNRPDFPKGKVDYNKCEKYKMPLLYKAAQSFLKKNKENQEYKAFLEQNNFWLEDYSLFISLSQKYNTYCWYKDWDKAFKERDEKSLEKFKEENKENIEEIKVIQYFFFRQWFKLKKYANDKGIKIIGDMPIFVAADSVDAWADPKLFKTDAKGNFSAVSGYPPDSNGNNGQMWGTPVYDWEAHKKQDYKWWINRIKHLVTLTDYLRIDHFIGFYHYWEIPAGKQPIDGKWSPTYGKQMFRKLRETLGKLPIIAEDLGELTDEVIELRDENEFPGMRVFEFGFSWKEGVMEIDNPFLPDNFITHTVAYSGTHDNEMLKSWFKNKSSFEQKAIKAYLESSEENIVDAAIRKLLASKANFVIIPVQDILHLDNSFRMNSPGTCGDHNWSYQLLNFARLKEEAETISNYNTRYSRG